VDGLKVSVIENYLKSNFVVYRLRAYFNGEYGNLNNGKNEYDGKR
jgi:hypothetical protein